MEAVKEGMITAMAVLIFCVAISYFTLKCTQISEVSDKVNAYSSLATSMAYDKAAESRYAVSPERCPADDIIAFLMDDNICCDVLIIDPYIGNIFIDKNEHNMFKAGEYAGILAGEYDVLRIYTESLLSCIKFVKRS